MQEGSQTEGGVPNVPRLTIVAAPTNNRATLKLGLPSSSGCFRGFPVPLSHHHGQEGVGTLFDRHRQVADAERVEGVGTADAERILHEVADGRQHRRHLVGVLALGALGGDVLES